MTDDIVNCLRAAADENNTLRDEIDRLRENMVLVPRDLSYLQAARLATALGYTIAEMTDVYGFVLDTLATPKES